jgi:hypothetical protein
MAELSDGFMSKKEERAWKNSGYGPEQFNDWAAEYRGGANDSGNPTTNWTKPTSTYSNNSNNSEKPKPPSSSSRGGLSKREWEKKYGTKWKGDSSSSSKSSSKSDNSAAEAAKKAEKAAKKAAKEKEKREKAARNAIGEKGDIIRSGLDSLIGLIPGQQQSSIDRLRGQAGSSKQNILDARDLAQGRFGVMNEDILNNQKGTLRDLSSDVRNAFQAGNIYLGSRGAADSSAAGMYSRGIQQAANKNRADVLNQTSGDLANLNLQQEEMMAMADTEMRKVDDWLNQSVADLEATFNDRMAQLQMAKVNASAEELQAIAQLEMGLLNDAQQQYNQLVSDANFYTSQVQNAVSDAAAMSGSGAQSLNDLARGGFDSPVAKPLDTGITTESRNTGGDTWSAPVIPQKKSLDEVTSSNPLLTANSPTFPSGTAANFPGTYNNRLNPPIPLKYNY